MDARHRSPPRIPVTGPSFLGETTLVRPVIVLPGVERVALSRESRDAPPAVLASRLEAATGAP